MPLLLIFLKWLVIFSCIFIFVFVNCCKVVLFSVNCLQWLHERGRGYSLGVWACHVVCRSLLSPTRLTPHILSCLLCAHTCPCSLLGKTSHAELCWLVSYLPNESVIVVACMLELYVPLIISPKFWAWLHPSFRIPQNVWLDIGTLFRLFASHSCSWSIIFEADHFSHRMAF